MQSRQNSRTPIWPYVAVVVCLFLLSILASQTWRSSQVSLAPIQHGSIARSREAGKSKHHSIAFNAAATGEVAFDNETNAAPSLALNSPFAIEVPREVAPVLPEVGERITFDASVKDLSSLPPISQPTTNATSPSAESLSHDASVELTPPTDSIPSDNDPRSIEQTIPVESHASQPAEPAPRVVEIQADENRVFPYSSDLTRSYEQLCELPASRDWALRALALLEQIYGSTEFSSVGSRKLVEQLSNHAQQAPKVSERVQPLVDRANILRVGYATLRRTEIWHQVQNIIATGADRGPRFNPAKISASLGAVDKRLQEASHTDQWRQYLLLHELAHVSKTGGEAACSELANRVLKRIESPQLNDKQAEVFRNSPFDAFVSDLRSWTNEPVDYLKMLDYIERYEKSRTTADAIPVAHCYDRLRASPNAEVQKLVSLLEAHYRNSNVRVALSAEFLNRLLPDPQQIQENIVDNISGADVYGTTNTLNQLRVVLVPDGNNWRIGLEAHGEVASDTSASKGPATFYNQGLARYHARKLLLIDRRGIRVWRAEAVADSHTELTGFETDFDGLPLIGWLARSVARQQHDDHYYDAKAEAEAKLEHRAISRFDDEVHAKLAEAEKQVNQKLIQPFERIALKPTPLDLRTTEQRIIARYRLASDEQLGAHSPRPQAPGDSLLSVQIHETALNNTLANLRLEGKRTELRDLFRELANTFERGDLPIPEDIPENVIVQFADEEAVRVMCEDGKVTLTMRIAELKSGRDFSWKDFAVRAYYVPDAKQLQANLVRDGIIELKGEQLGNHRLLLRGIFNKVLSKTRTFNIVNNKLAENPRLRDVRVHQFVINDGWIGVAMGPTSSGDLEHLAKQKQSKVDR